ncbi:fumarylacetoacetate hydrolase family protein [Nocardioides flavescens]|uniref:2-hydroxyhepta-2,4-diene-1,7-dioate isomerase n=1 Tax=Nocardioides flavescens TaxID=2691959 RepID=A0A6L7EPL6_9ACTN|nr:fumarylacetoacetate hydrolase family protein [Nocardioides flavescens]MXG89253.1 2-hydroxyhepta-2,4-diene-1,7-dioate isomerase [Nocardioides flavescens]
MRLARAGEPGAERPVAQDESGAWRDLTEVVGDLDPSALAPEALKRVATAVAGGDLPVVAEAARFGPPLARIGKIVCVGLNYRDHARETGAEVPAEPVLFMKAPDTVVGPDDEVLVPRGSDRTDWEVELAVVIGSTAAYLETHEDAAAAIAGYAISHDVSERTFQLDRGGQWDKGKNCATFNPFGPWLVTADEVGDPQRLGLRLWVNGELKQDGTTADMVFGVHEIVRYVSQFMTLHPGDVINTGTPAGVALGVPGTPYLVAGDVVELEIDGLGRQRQQFGSA